ncbi:MAG: 16S rRNA (uracil(1498)-N(3))-methyltransferase [Thermodesulfovibrionales bacterium]|nr:16S rRNA (uracil(1498)-N(3))-methyltransferase [Thermodesulfovibrionales bacterium]
MSYISIYLPSEEISKKNHIHLPYGKNHYLLNVMRCKVGDIFTVIDGKGSSYNARVQQIKNKKIIIDILEKIEINTESEFNLILCQGIIKANKMDIVIQKATELGVKKIIPLITERVVGRKMDKVKRWQKIAEEATEQCGRAIIPDISEPIGMEDFFKGDSLKGLIFWEEGGKDILDAFKDLIERYSMNTLKNESIYLLIGPEGGLTKDEVLKAEKSGFVKTTLGKRLLKAETAAMVALALVEFLLKCSFTFSVQDKNFLRFR